jgi:hypothetical protein
VKGGEIVECKPILLVLRVKKVFTSELLGMNMKDQRLEWWLWSRHSCQRITEFWMPKTLPVHQFGKFNGYYPVLIAGTVCYVDSGDLHPCRGEASRGICGWGMREKGLTP